MPKTSSPKRATRRVIDPSSQLVRASQAEESKSELGQFFTMEDPFDFPVFKEWMAQIPQGAAFIEPFAGANNLVRLMNQHFPDLTWHCYDIAPEDPQVEQRDTLTNFPQLTASTKAVITNPPYLGKNVATRQGHHAVAKTIGVWDNLYKRCIAECLSHTQYVAAIIPESFITCPDMKDRLWAVISLNRPMFVDTEVPVCLALFTPETSNDFQVWQGANKLGMWSALSSHVPTIISDRITFNDASGTIALLAVDSTKTSTIRFDVGSVVAASEIKVSSRHRTRISIEHLDKKLVPEVITEANKILAEVRASTRDVVLTAFMGLREDGHYRRRLDFALARTILTKALHAVEKKHGKNQ